MFHARRVCRRSAVSSSIVRNLVAAGMVAAAWAAVQATSLDVTVSHARPHGPLGGSQPGVIIQSKVPAAASTIATLPIFFEQADAGPEQTVTDFTTCVDYDPLDLTFDPTDGDSSGLPDSTRFFVGENVIANVTHDLEREDCELFITVDSPEPVPEALVIEIDFAVSPLPSGSILTVGCGDPAGLAFTTGTRDPATGFCSPGSFAVAGSAACEVTLAIGSGTAAPGATGVAVPVFVSSNVELRSITMGLDFPADLTLAGCEPLIDGFVCTTGPEGATLEPMADAVIPSAGGIARLELLFDVAAEAQPGQLALTPMNATVLGLDAEPCNINAGPGTFTVQGCAVAEDCDDGIACTLDECVPERGCVHHTNDAACDDGQACTVDSCDPQAGGCVATADHVFCDDGSFCNGMESCTAETGCTAGSPLDCDDGDVCTDDACVEEADSCENTFDQSNASECEPSATPEIPVFSVSAVQFLAGQTLRPGDVLSWVGDAIERLVGSFLPQVVDLDALDVGADGGLLFSVRSNVGVTHTGGFTVLRHDRLYELQESGAIVPVPDWGEWGIPIASLDAIDRLEDGSLAFSSNMLQGIHHSGGYTVLRPGNVYRFDPADGTISLYFDGRARGFRAIDALDVGMDGRIALSFDQSQTVQTSNGPVSARHANVYWYDPVEETLTLAFDFESMGIATVDAFSLAGTSTGGPAAIDDAATAPAEASGEDRGNPARRIWSKQGYGAGD